jgi:hypothetical protein
MSIKIAIYAIKTIRYAHSIGDPMSVRARTMGLAIPSSSFNCRPINLSSTFQICCALAL